MSLDNTVINRVGTVESEGDIAIASNDIRNLSGIDGNGIKIGVISDSYDVLSTGSGAADNVIAGDLPGLGNPNGYTAPVTVLNEGSPEKGRDEGRAMLQILHDVAPGAELFFYSVSDNTDMAPAIESLTDAGVDIIVDDMGFTDQPFFQDGLAARAVDNAVARGITYFSAAGNDGDRSYENPFSNSGQTFTLDGIEYEAHSFGGSDVFNRFSLARGDSVRLSFQWSEPFASLGGPGATGDLDIFITTDDDLGTLDASDIVMASMDDNLGGDPLELLSFTNDTDGQSFNILIGKRVGSGDPQLMKYINFYDDAEGFEFDYNSSTVFGHPNAESAIAVGAVNYDSTPAFGVATPSVRSSSSTGGTSILFDTTGTALATPEERLKPTLVAPNGVSTTVSGFESFYGTSAAAPHAAGVAALMLDAAGGSGSLTPAEIEAVLNGTAIDADVAGVDFRSGSGLIQADAAVSLVDSGLVRVSRDATSEPNLGTPANDELTGSAASEVLAGFGGDDAILGEAGDDQLYGGQGNDILLGRQGHDILSGNKGDDLLIGGEGGDRFDLQPDGGFDTFGDFVPGEDIIGLAGGLTFSQLSLSATPGGTLVEMTDGTDLATVEGVYPQELGADNFLSF